MIVCWKCCSLLVSQVLSQSDVDAIPVMSHRVEDEGDDVRVDGGMDLYFKGEDVFKAMVTAVSMAIWFVMNGYSVEDRGVLHLLDRDGNIACRVHGGCKVE